MTDENTRREQPDDGRSESERAAGGQPAGEHSDVVRTQTFAMDGPGEVHITIGAGEVDVILDERQDMEVEVRQAGSGAVPWAQGLSGLLSWVNEQFPQVADAVGAPEGVLGSVADAVRQTRIDMTGGRLVVRTPQKSHPLRHIPLAVTVRAPSTSQVTVRGSEASVALTGTAGRTELDSGSGAVSVATTDGPTTVRSSSGDISIGRCHQQLHARSSSGDIEAFTLDDEATVVTGTGDVRLGTVSGSLRARTGSGDLSISDAVREHVEVVTGSGGIRVGIHPGTRAELDLIADSGSIRSELTVADNPPEQDPELFVRARTGSGDVVITGASG